MKALFNQRLILRSRLGLQLALKAELVYLKANGSYTDYYIWKNGQLKRITQAGHLALHAAKVEDRFLRISKSCLVNLDFVDQIRNDRSILLSVPTQEPIVISTRYWRHMKRFI